MSDGRCRQSVFASVFQPSGVWYMAGLLQMKATIAFMSAFSPDTYNATSCHNTLRPAGQISVLALRHKFMMVPLLSRALPELPCALHDLNSALPDLNSALPELKKKLIAHKIVPRSCFVRMLDCTRLGRSRSKRCPIFCSLRNKLCPNFGRSHTRLCLISFAPCRVPNIAGTLQMVSSIAAPHSIKATTNDWMVHL